jgi:hypothetical protein
MEGTESPWVVDEVPFPTKPGNAQNGTDGTLARGQQRTKQQYLRMPPGALLHKHAREW